MGLPEPDLPAPADSLQMQWQRALYDGCMTARPIAVTAAASVAAGASAGVLLIPFRRRCAARPPPSGPNRSFENAQ